MPVIVKEVILTPTPIPTATPTIIPVSTSTPIPAPISQSDQLSLAELESKASKSVVKISSSNGVGSGVIYELSGEDAYILTNQHVVGYSSNVDVILTDVETFSGEVITIDVQKDIDIVLSLEKRHFGALSGQGLVQTALQNYQKAIDSYIEAHKIYPAMETPLIMIEKLNLLIKKQSI